MNELIGRKIVVLCDTAAGEKQFIGVLKSIDGIWLCLMKGEEANYFCLYNVRLVRAFES